jgi:hypothetical protein
MLSTTLCPLTAILAQKKNENEERNALRTFGTCPVVEETLTMNTVCCHPSTEGQGKCWLQLI